MLTLTRASAESAFVRTDIGCHLFGHFGRWLPTSLQVKQRSSCCNLAIFSQVSLVVLLQAGRVEAGFDATEERQLYTELAGRLLRLACWPVVFVFMFVFVSRLYQFLARLTAGVWILISFRSWYASWHCFAYSWMSFGQDTPLAIVQKSNGVSLNFNSLISVDSLWSNSDAKTWNLAQKLLKSFVIFRSWNLFMAVCFWLTSS